MEFTKNSGCVKVWITLIQNNIYSYKDVPNLFNLRKQVKISLDKIEI